MCIISLVRKLKLIRLYPLALAVYPILAVYNHNILYVSPAALLRSLAIAVLLTGLGLVVLNGILKDPGRASLLLSLGLALFFSYGHIYTLLKEYLPPLGHHRYLAALWGALALAGGWWLTKRLADTRPLSNFVAATGVLLLAFSLLQAAAFSYGVYRANREAAQRAPVVEADTDSAGQAWPDVYYIILDAHARSDVLEEVYGYDNSTFIAELEGLGFYVAECSQSNYSSTRYSISSSLNMSYVQDLVEDVSALPAWKHSLVRQTLDAYGYTAIAFETIASHHDYFGADILLSRNPLVVENVSLLGGVSEFESELMRTTLLRLLTDLKALMPDGARAGTPAYYEHYLQTRFILDELAQLPEVEGPRFVFAHILVPHDPFIFSPSGEYEFIGFEDHLIGYRNQVEYLAWRIPEILRAIIEGAETPPVIIVQGDHGPPAVGAVNRMAILNAYYLPEDGEAQLYDSITPVNSFRVVFNSLFGESYPLLEDVSYFTEDQDLSQAEVIPNACGVE